MRALTALVVGAAMACAGRRSATPPAQPAVAGEPAPHASALPARAYEQPWSKLAPGDAIEISGLYGKTAGCVVGEEYIVTGRYKLASRDKAVLAVYATNGELDPPDNLHVAAGRGKFRFHFRVRKQGMLHVTFYPDPTGDGFGGMYFACE